jgi:hypothetical protein
VDETPAGQGLVISWLLVAVLLGYGIVQTLITAARIFTGQIRQERSSATPVGDATMDPWTR